MSYFLLRAELALRSFRTDPAAFRANGGKEICQDEEIAVDEQSASKDMMFRSTSLRYRLA
jgi:hypothetical protein